MGASDVATSPDASLAPADLTLKHLESSLAWYDRNARRSQFLYLSLAGPYAEAVVPHRLLAERLELLIEQEASKWVGLHEERGRSTSDRVTAERG